MRRSSGFVYRSALLTLFVVSLTLLFTGGGLVRAQANISGRVFQDYNNNGAFDAGRTIANNGAGAYTVAEDVPIAGVTITTFGPAGTPIGTVLSGTDGTYNIVPSGAGPYRVEFSGFPPGYLPGAFGAQNGSTIRFVDASGEAGVDLGINLPGEYCQDNPDLLSPCYVFGSQTGSFPAVDPNAPPIDNSGRSALVSFPYSAGSNDASIANGYDLPLTHTVDVSAGQIGTTWGVAWARVANRIFASSFYKRHSGFGPGADTVPGTPDDPGTIYVINPTTNAVVSSFVVPNVSINAHDSTNWFRDNNNAGWDAAGKTSLGGLALSEDETRLFVMNLQDRTLYALDAQTGAVVGTSAPFTSAPNCAASDVRPFAVSVYRGVLYVGVTCTAESTQSVANLIGYVYALNPGTLANNGVVFSLSFAHPRGIVNAPALSGAWLPWVPVFTELPPPAGLNAVFYPQPLLTDLAFDRGNLILAIRDRSGDQVGNFTQSNPASTELYFGIGAGDLLRACGNPQSGWVLEQNGRCGGIGNAAQNTALGPGGAEYYFDDGYGIAGQYIQHDDMGLGGVGQIPGFPDLVVASTNPYPFSSVGNPLNFHVFDGGVRWYNNTSGGFTKAYRLYDDQTSPAAYGKANGLGDIAVLCFPMPVEIGNRVWLDSNQNGIQDADETPIENVRVDLFSPTGDLLGSVFTNERGEYYFSNGAGTDMRFADYNVPGLTFNTGGFQIRIDGDQPPLVGLTLTFPENERGVAFGSSSNDNNGRPNGQVAVATFNVGGPGQNDHTIDFGYYSSTAPTPTQVTPIIPGTPGTPGAPGTQIAGGSTFSPSISKTVDRPFAAPGDTVTFTIFVRNPNGTVVNNVVLTDTIPSAFQVISASASRGTPSLNGQQVSLTIATLNPGETVTVTIVTRVRAGVGGGAVANLAIVSGGLDGQASVTVVIVSALPALGEEPWWRVVALIGIGAGGVWAVTHMRRRRLQSQ